MYLENLSDKISFAFVDSFKLGFRVHVCPGFVAINRKRESKE